MENSLVIGALVRLKGCNVLCRVTELGENSSLKVICIENDTSYYHTRVGESAFAPIGTVSKSIK